MISPLYVLETTTYTLIISAMDSNGNNISHNAVIKITVSDINDNLPRFNQSEYTYTLREDFPVNNVFGKVLATNNDLVYNTVQYKVLSNQGEVDQLFHLDNITGELSLVKNLDYEIKQSHTVIILAENNGTVNLISYSTVVVNIVNKNEYAPVFLPPFVYNISETLPLHSNVLTFSATDQDLGSFGIVTFSIDESSTDTFSLDPETGVLSLKKLLNASRYVYTINVTAKDLGSPPQTSNISIFIIVVDQNDNRPTFTKEEYKASIMENSLFGESLLTVFAYDGDFNLNGKVTYIILPIDLYLPFTINPNNGSIIVNGVIDYEIKRSYSFFVEAYDHGSPALSNTVLVSIKVIDQNDNSPVFRTLVYNQLVSDQISIGQSILTIVAFDADDGSNGVLSYSFTQGDSNLFVINSTSGLITLKRPFSRNFTRSYIFRVAVSDGGTPTRNGGNETVINITKIQSATHYPKFLLSNYVFNVPEGISPIVLGDIIATDNDTSSKDLIYTIQGNWKQLKINSNGTLQVTEKLDFELQPSYSFIIDVMDDSVPPAHDKTHILVNVIDVDDEKPVLFLPYQIQLKVGESTEVGKIVTIVQAKDPDVISRNFTFSLKNHNDIFYIKGRNDIGMIILKEPLNCSYKDYLRLEIGASDNFGNVADVNLLVNVSVIDENINCPIFTKEMYTITIPENTILEKGFLHAEAFDKDCSINNSHIRYEINDVLTPNVFQVDPSNGMLSMIKPLDYEKNQTYELYVSAMNFHQQLCNARAKVLINVVDENDNFPVIYPPSFFSVREDVEVGSILFDISAGDEDSYDNGKQIFSIFGVSSDLPLKINQETGSLILIAALDFELQANYEFIVTVSDKGIDKQLNSSVTYHMNILDVNDNRPLFQENITLSVINEEQPNGTFIGCIPVTDSDSKNNGEVTFTILPYLDATFFFINTLGCLYTSGVIDVDTVKPKIDNIAYFDLIIKCQDKGDIPLINTNTVAIGIRNINDNLPFFLAQKYQVNVSESAPIGTSIIKMQGFDADDNSRLQYKIESGNNENIFYIQSDTGNIYLNKSVDFELDIREYIISISIHDGVHQNRLNATVFISIINSDDNQPAFPLSLYNIVLPEQTLTGSVLIQLNATDKDYLNSVSYSMAVSPDAKYFTINPISGKVKLRQQLNYESQRFHVVTVLATSMGHHSFVGTTQLVVNVTDDNDNGPIFNHPLQRNLEISENLDVGMVITQVSASDRDETTNGMIDYSIKGSSNYFAVSNTGIIYLKNHLNREYMGTHIIEIHAADKGVPLRTSSMFLYINVTDHNEFSPMFTRLSYHANVSESTQVNTFILKVMASDQDASSPNNKIKFYLQGTELFKIDEESGIITLNNSLDYESLQTLNFLVIAKDSGKIQLESSTVVHINIVNDNDNIPSLKPPFNYKVMENLPVGYRIMTVTGDDLDGDLNALHYSFAEDYRGFALDSSLGHITITETLDFERYQFHNLTVTVTDGLFNSSVMYTIFVIDTNDNEPIFFKHHYVFSINEDLSLNSKIGCIHATDKESSTFDYNLTTIEGNISTYFTINRTTGCIYLINYVDRETSDKHNLKVTVYDLDIVQLGNIATVDIVVKDINDNHPVIHSHHFSFTVLENTLRGSILFNLIGFASDRDSSSNGKLLFTVTKGNINKTFFVDSNQQLILGGNLDYERLSFYNISIRVSDLGDPALIADKEITGFISVGDINEHNPEFEKSRYEFIVNENDLFSAIVVAHDGDIDDQLKYNIPYELVSNMFTINQHTGLIQNTSTIDYEANKTFQFIITATDYNKDTGARYGFATAYFTVVDINDNIPTFKQNTYFVNVSETLSINSDIIRVKAYDNDSTSNGKVSFFIDENPNAHQFFTIGEDTGNDTLKSVIRL